jgi:hypothetical protein
VEDDLKMDFLDYQQSLSGSQIGQKDPLRSLFYFGPAVLSLLGHFLK